MQQASPIHRLLFSTAKKAHRGLETWFADAKLGITPLQFGVLKSIEPTGSTLNELARRMVLKPPSLLPTIDFLERAGYLAGRKKNMEDRRKITLLVSPKGKRLIARVISTRTRDPLSLAFQKLSPPKKKQLIALLTELDGRIETK